MLILNLFQWKPWHVLMMILMFENADSNWPFFSLSPEIWNAWCGECRSIPSHYVMLEFQREMHSHLRCLSASNWFCGFHTKIIKLIQLLLKMSTHLKRFRVRDCSHPHHFNVIIIKMNYISVRHSFRSIQFGPYSAIPTLALGLRNINSNEILQFPCLSFRTIRGVHR